MSRCRARGGGTTGLAALILALAMAGCASSSAPPSGPTDAGGAAISDRSQRPERRLPCARQLAAFLAIAGLGLADLKDVRVREDRLAGGQPGEQVGHWHVSGRPTTCARGRLEVIILSDCAIDDWEATGGCRLPALEPTPPLPPPPG